MCRTQLKTPEPILPPATPAVLAIAIGSTIPTGIVASVKDRGGASTGALGASLSVGGALQLHGSPS